MFEILFPLTGTTVDYDAQPHALEMARLLDGRVHLVRVMESRRASDRPIEPLDWHVKKLEAEASLQRMGRLFRAANVEVEEVLLEGDPAEHLVNYARTCPSEMAVLASGPQRGSYGLTGGDLLFRAHLTTLIVRPGTPSEREGARSGGPGREAGTAPASGRAQGDAPAAALSPVSPRAARTARGRAGVSEFMPTFGPVLGASPASARSPAQGAAQVAPESGAYLGRPPGAADVPRGPGAPPGPGAMEPGEGEDAEAREPVRYRRILTALDGSRRAEAVLSWVRRIAERHGSEVVVAHVVVEPELPRLTPPSDEDLELVRRLMERNREEAAVYLEGAVARLGIDAEVRLLQERRASPALHDLVEREGVDLVVLNAHGYGGESRWPFGAVATSFIDYGTTPLLLVQDMPRAEPRAAQVTDEKWGG